MYVKGVQRDSKYTIRAHNIFVHNFVNIQLIFNLKKYFEKLRLRAFQPYHQMIYMSQHVKGVEVPLTYMTFDGMVGKIQVSAF